MRRRIAELRAEETVNKELEQEQGDMEEDISPLVTAADVVDVLGCEADEAAVEPYELPNGFVAVAEPPPAAQLVRFAGGIDAPDVVKKPICLNFPGYGWLNGRVLRRNGDARRKMDDGTVANFIIQFDMDEGVTTAALLEVEDYATDPAAPAGAWFLLVSEPCEGGGEGGDEGGDEAGSEAGSEGNGEAVEAVEAGVEVGIEAGGEASGEAGGEGAADDVGGMEAELPPSAEPYGSLEDVDSAIKNDGLSLWVSDYPDTLEGNANLKKVLQDKQHAIKVSRLAATTCELFGFSKRVVQCAKSVVQ